MDKPRRGDIFYCDLRVSVGHAMSNVRPVLILTDAGLALYPTVIIAPITTKIQNCTTHVFVRSVQSGLKEDSDIVLEQIRSVNVEWLREKVWSMPSDVMAKVDEKLDLCFGRTRDKGGEVVEGLIPINYNNDRQTVNGRTLHEFLVVETPYTQWFDRMIQYGFSENVDFVGLSQNCEKPQGGRPATDHQLTIEMAKELCMLQRTEKGKQARQYFIELEKAWNSPEAIMARALKMADSKILSLQSAVDEMKPKAEGYDNLMNATGTVTIAEAAALIGIPGIGQNKLFKLLKTEDIIFKKGNSYVPRSEYLEHFIIKQNPVRKGDEFENRSQLYLDMKGLDWLAKLLSRRGHSVNYKMREAV